ncbi:MAG: T9SS type A sorting domain-containing protein, partial [Bacteroidota bacterium]
ALHLPNPLGYCQRDSRLLVNQNYIDGFINFVHNLEANSNPTQVVEVAYVANLLTHFTFDDITFLCMQSCGHPSALNPMDNYDCTSSLDYSYEGNEALFNNDPNVYRFELYYKETQDAITYLVDQLKLTPEDVIYVEMGNEYYFNDGLNSAYFKYDINASDYARLVETYAERLSCFFANQVDLKIGMVSKPGSNWQNTNNIFNLNYPGLVNLMDQDETANGQTLNDLVDAVILHDYYTNSDCLNENDISDRFNCAKVTLNEQIESENGLLAELDNFRNNFPGKEIWLTEWNVTAGTESKNLNYINTPLHATFVMEYALRLLTYNANHDNLISLAMHHRIGQDNQWSVIQTEDGDNELAIARTGAYVMQYLSKLYDYESSSLIGNILVDGNTTFATENAKTSVFYQAADALHNHPRLLVYYTNKTAQGISFSLPSQIDEHYVTGASMAFLQGNELFTYGASNHTNGKNSFQNNEGIHQNEDLNHLGYGPLHNQLQYTAEEAIDITQHQLIGSYSVGVIEIQLSPIVGTTTPPYANRHLLAYPNPAKDQLNMTVSVSSPQTGYLKLYDQQGRLLKNQVYELLTNNNLISLSVDDLSDGVYFIQLQTEHELFRTKVIVN